MLLFLQAAALSLGIIPIWQIARRLVKLHFGISVAVVFVYSLYAGVHNLNLSGFSPSSIALPALLWALYLGLSMGTVNLKYHHIKYWAVVFVVLICRADLGVALAGLGVLLAVEGKRKVGLYTLGISAAWVILAVLVIQPAFGDGYPAIEPYLSYGDNPFEVFWGMITSPSQIISEVRTFENLESVVQLLGPLAFLPLVRPRYILPILPLYFLYLIADVPQDALGEADQNAPMIAFLFVATIFSLKRVGTVLLERVRVNTSIIWTLVLAASLFFLRDSVSSPYMEPWRWNDRNSTLQEAVDTVPSGVAVRASSNTLSHLAERQMLFELATTSEGPAADAKRAIESASWILLDTTIVSEWEGDEAETIQRFESVLTESGWTRVYSNNGVLVYRLT